MIRRDYILRMIEEFFQILNRINSLKTSQQLDKAGEELDQGFKKLIGGGTEFVGTLSETELLASVIRGESTLAVRDKNLIVTSLLKEAGDVALGQGRREEARSFYLKGLHLLLQTPVSEELSSWPGFVPRLEVFLQALNDSPLPLQTLAMLMHHYESSGQFAKAENALFSMLDLEPGNPALVDFGFTFYERLQHQPDSSLDFGELPRAELESGAAELRQRKAALA